MDAQRWLRIGELYHLADPMPSSARAAFLSNACGDDSALQREVTSLLEAQATSGGFLDTPVFELGLQILKDDGVEVSAGPSGRQPNRLIGKILDERYLILSELGHGGVGAVYLARDRKLHDKPVVVKTLLEKSLQNDWVVLKFQQEKEALARVDHPGVVGILDTIELPDKELYIVMQYVDGVTLREVIKSQPEGIELRRAASIVKQAGSALSAVHQKKIYHRDLKPENIMLQRLGRGEEQVKIVDFGVAKVKQSLVAASTVTGTVSAGTAVYMSPEQLRVEKVTAASDIYSLGVVAYEMVTGRRPFKPASVAHLAELQRQGVRARPTALRPLLSEEAEAIILKALAFEPRARYQDAADFGDAFARAIYDEEDALSMGRMATEEFPPTQSSNQPLAASQPVRTAKSIFDPPHASGPPQTLPPTFLGEKVRKSRRNFVIAAAGLAVVLLIAAYLVVTNRRSLWGTGTDQRAIAYSLTVQKMRDGKPYQEPFKSSGREIFENGYKFRLNVSSPQSGYLYVFNEGADENGGMSFTIIYPTPETNKGSAKLGGNEQMNTNWNTFAGKAGTEQFWIIWSASPAVQLEAARNAAFQQPEGALTDAAMVRTVKEFLSNHSNPEPETTKNPLSLETNVRANGELLVKLVELEHR